MKKLLEKLLSASQNLWGRLKSNPVWLRTFNYCKVKILLGIQKLKVANFKMVAYTQPRLETLVRRVSKNQEFALSFKATQIILYIAIYIVLSTLWHFIGGFVEDTKARDARMRPVSVVTSPVKLGKITVVQTALGTVTPRNTVTVFPQVSGILSKVFFKEGDLVQAGQLLALIDPRPFEASLKQAEGTLSKDKALLANAELDLKRYDTLLKQDSISKQVYATQKSLVEQYKGNVLTDEGLVSNAKLQLEFAHITSPINGRIGMRLVDPGNLVQPNNATGLFVITQLQPTTVLFSVPQEVIPSFRKFLQEPPPPEVIAIVDTIKTVPPANASYTDHSKQNRSAKTDSTSNAPEKIIIPVESWNSDSTKKLSTGYLESIDNQIDITTGTVKLRGIFSNDEMNLFPNQFVNVRVILDVLSDVVVIPVPAVQRGTPGTFVYRLNSNNTVSVVPVKLGPVDGYNVQVLEGLEPGNIVVVDGTDKLRNGAKVMVGQASGAANAGGKGAKGSGQASKP
ncbi:multidrug efflux system membrane fusion protein [Polynucleobacter sphagniphilus]|jgi:multidrug efflux system membrane fusion protein|uniref:efflux RND transporter periplasmic adaptor subunit n=1 Tax=Polynucleobacter sphagniphilus TaxID=1743169 RepID=UPI002476A0E3|nr:efflux RND transporter periplasmic adaptor subunit [Polynucleobacter sphagniphilus]MDH6240517.1 multidrug efflux system membrane fusion protein [Polynucleobacter sphagniphilus]